MSAPKSILLDNDFITDRKIQAVLDRYGYAGLGLYVHMLTRLNDEKGRMPKAAMERLHRMIYAPIEEWTCFLSFCLTENLLSENDTEYFIERVVDDVKRVEAKRKKWADDKRRLRKTSGGRPSETSEEEEEQEELDKKNGAAKIPIDLDGHVLMTEREAEKLQTDLGPECFECLIADAVDFAKTNPPKWGKYKDHAAFIRNSMKLKRRRGIVFFKHPRDGPGFYPQWEIEKLQGK